MGERPAADRSSADRSSADRSSADQSRRKRIRPFVAVAAAVTLGASGAIGATVASASPAPNVYPGYHTPAAVPASLYITPHTVTPIQHLVVIFDENETFDHYFGTYPFAANTDGTPFHAKPGTPAVNGLYTKITSSGPAGPLLTSNPNQFNPQRLTHSQALTSSQNHSYGPEQKAIDGGKMDLFVQNTENHACSAPLFCAPGIVMDYYDGNTVTALWNYAQNYAMSDNHWDSTFGPSTPGALNLISGNTSPAHAVKVSDGSTTTSPAIPDPDKNGNGSVNGDLDPAFDGCSDNGHVSTNPLGVVTSKNIGDLLNNQHITWGWFQGGFIPSGTSTAGFPLCGSTSPNIGGAQVTQYVPHHEPFQYYASTANPNHTKPSSEAAIGRTDAANHQYDISDFFTTLQDGNMPAVSFLKPPAAQNAHPANSDPLDEQAFLVNTINQIERSHFWSSTAIVVTYDDSDGWYDHVAPQIINGSSDPNTDQPLCSSVGPKLGSFSNRCGFSQRLPLLVISPWTKQNFVSHEMTDTASVTRFIEDNWLHGQRLGDGSFDAVSPSLTGPGGVLSPTLPHFVPVILDPTTGAVAGHK